MFYRKNECYIRLFDYYPLSIVLIMLITNKILTIFTTNSTSFSVTVFNAKEKDYETGFHYYGSRYYSSELSIWNSTDPMADKYPSLTPYNYCANNPVKLIDPNGEDIEITKNDQNKTVTIRANFYYSRKEIGKVTDVFINGFKLALNSWSKDIETALKDETLGASGYNVYFEFGYKECDDPQSEALADKNHIGNWITNDMNLSSSVEAEVRGCRNLRVDFSKNLFSNIEDNPIFYGNNEYQGVLKHEIGHLFGLYDRYNNGEKSITPIHKDLMDKDVHRNNAIEPFKRIWKSVGLHNQGSKQILINKKNREKK